MSGFGRAKQGQRTSRPQPHTLNLWHHSEVSVIIIVSHMTFKVPVVVSHRAGGRSRSPYPYGLHPHHPIVIGRSRDRGMSQSIREKSFKRNEERVDWSKSPVLVHGTFHDLSEHVLPLLLLVLFFYDKPKTNWNYKNNRLRPKIILNNRIKSYH